MLRLCCSGKSNQGEWFGAFRVDVLRVRPRTKVQVLEMGTFVFFFTLRFAERETEHNSPFESKSTGGLHFSYSRRTSFPDSGRYLRFLSFLLSRFSIGSQFADSPSFWVRNNSSAGFAVEPKKFGVCSERLEHEASRHHW